MSIEQRNLYPNHHGICSVCGMAGAVVIVPTNRQFYCLRCLQQKVPLLYLQLSNWVEDHKPAQS